MKKFKYIPSIMLLLLCVTVLVIGIKAAKPISNNVTGTATISSVNSKVGIKICTVTDGVETVVSSGETRTGKNLTLTYSTVSFEPGDLDYEYELPLQEIRVKITNKSEVDLGAYFCTEETANNLPVQATAEDILYGHQTHGTYFDYEYAFYNHIPHKQDDTEIEITMSIYIRVKEFPSVDVDENIPIFVAIEPYQPNYNSEATGFVKIGTEDVGTKLVGDFWEYDDDLNIIGTEKTAFNNCIPVDWLNGSQVTHLVIPYGTQIITGYLSTTVYQFMSFFTSYSGDEYSSSLKAVTIPSSITSIQYAVFDHCQLLESVIFPFASYSIGIDTGFNWDEFSYTGLTTIVIVGEVNLNGPSFLHCDSLKSVVINGMGESYLWGFNFLNLANLEFVLISGNVLKTGACIFENCPNLVRAYLYITTSTYKPNDWSCSWFRGCHENLVIHIPSTLTDYGRGDDAFGPYWAYRTSTTDYYNNEHIKADL